MANKCKFFFFLRVFSFLDGVNFQLSWESSLFLIPCIDVCTQCHYTKLCIRLPIEYAEKTVQSTALSKLPTRNSVGSLFSCCFEPHWACSKELFLRERKYICVLTSQCCPFCQRGYSTRHFRPVPGHSCLKGQQQLHSLGSSKSVFLLGIVLSYKLYRCFGILLRLLLFQAVLLTYRVS